jgi:hypothetical protein
VPHVRRGRRDRVAQATTTHELDGLGDQVRADVLGDGSSTACSTAPWIAGSSTSETVIAGSIVWPSQKRSKIRGSM